jgi:hypothetical protein
MQPLTCSSQVMPNESFPCFTTDAVVGEFQIYFGGQPPFSSKVRSAPSTCTSALRLTTPHAPSLNQLLATTSVTFGLTLALLFLPAMILINAVVDPDFLSKLRVSFVPHAHRHSFTCFFVRFRSTNASAGWEPNRRRIQSEIGINGDVNEL